MWKAVSKYPQPHSRWILAITLLVSGCDGNHYETAPDFSLQDKTGTVYQLNSFNPQIATGNLQGDYLLINFWASWCSPCVREMPLLQQVHNNHKQALTVVGIAADEIDRAQNFADQLGLTYPLLYAEPLDIYKLMGAYGNPQGNLPYTVLINPAGEITWQHLGQLDDEQLSILPIH